MLGLGVAAMLLGLLFPKAARAVENFLATVTNGPNNPVLVRDVDNPGRLPFVGRCTASICTISGPPGQRVVVQYISSRIANANCDYVLLSGVVNFTERAIIPCTRAT